MDMNELINVVIDAMKANATAEAPKKVDPMELMKEAAKRTAVSTKNLYDAYIEAGFSAEQAFELTKITVAKKKG